MKDNLIFHLAVVFVLGIVTYLLCAKALPLLNQAADRSFIEGAVLMIVAAAMWLLTIIIVRKP